jgi:RecG-like helicase
MSSEDFKKFSDEEHTSTLVNAATAAFAELMTSMVAELPHGQKLLLTNVLENGGRIGIESTVDKHGNQSLQLIAIEPEGTRRTVAKIAMKRR